MARGKPVRLQQGGQRSQLALGGPGRTEGGLLNRLPHTANSEIHSGRGDTRDPATVARGETQSQRV